MYNSIIPKSMRSILVYFTRRMSWCFKPGKPPPKNSKEYNRQYGVVEYISTNQHGDYYWGEHDNILNGRIGGLGTRITYDKLPQACKELLARIYKELWDSCHAKH